MKLTKQQLRLQAQVDERLSQSTLTVEDVEFIYSSYHEGSGGDVAANAAHFTPEELAMDHALMIGAGAGDTIVDIASGIGMLAYSCVQRSFYSTPIKSITLVEINPVYSDLSRRLLTVLSAYNESHTVIEMNFVNANIFDQRVWMSASTMVGGQWDLALSNPPFAACSKEDRILAEPWMNYIGKRDVMAIELAMRYARRGGYVLPPQSVEFRYSGRQWGYERCESREIARLRKLNPDKFLHMESTSVDCSQYRTDWRSTNITVESCDLCFNRSEYE